MRLFTLLFGVLITSTGFTQGCVFGSLPSQPRYVCFDGRTLDASPTGYVWNAKRGCFISSYPCCAYNANHYSYYPNPKNIGDSYARCRRAYPFRLGEMQTH